MMPVTPFRPTDRANLAHLLASYRTWLLENTAEVAEAERVGVEIRNLKETDWQPQGYHLARAADGDVTGCIVMKLVDDTVLISRFHVSRPGGGTGRLLLNYALQIAASQRVRCVELDTSIKMVAAQHLYLSLGFVDVTKEHDAPEAGVIYFRKVLR
ncbi:GNAT family N-acetyltransferase [Sinirhodobacter populi]|uniref:GNAT family N-acetyltransferase n=2 Tax=Paenirhodobacter populi TaxID=2306993 RepID=A0A443J8A6_9RHOB|nr:GNAT family N-acetyltransferase [Sinirhodobacter populi]